MKKSILVLSLIIGCLSLSVVRADIASDSCRIQNSQGQGLDPIVGIWLTRAPADLSESGFQWGHFNFYPNGIGTIDATDHFAVPIFGLTHFLTTGAFNWKKTANGKYHLTSTAEVMGSDPSTTSFPYNLTGLPAYANFRVVVTFDVKINPDCQSFTDSGNIYLYGLDDLTLSGPSIFLGSITQVGQRLSNK